MGIVKEIVKAARKRTKKSKKNKPEHKIKIEDYCCKKEEKPVESY